MFYLFVLNKYLTSLCFGLIRATQRFEWSISVIYRYNDCQCFRIRNKFLSGCFYVLIYVKKIVVSSYQVPTVLLLTATLYYQNIQVTLYEQAIYRLDLF